MTILLLFGLVAATALVRFLFSLATIALPVSTGIALGLSLHSAGVGIAASLAAACLVALVLLAGGAAAYRAAHAPLSRLFLLFIFVLPAAVAGYSVGRAVSALVLDQRLAATIFGLLCAAITAIAAHRTLRGSATA